MNKGLLFVIGLVISGLCSANVITVDDNGIADFNNIQEAINHAFNGDVIIVLPSVYEGDVNFAGKNIVLTSINP